MSFSLFAPPSKQVFHRNALPANLTEVDQTDNSNPGSPRTASTTWTYLSNGNVASETDPNGNTTQITYQNQNCPNRYPSAVTVAGPAASKRPKKKTMLRIG